MLEDVTETNDKIKDRMMQIIKIKRDGMDIHRTAKSLEKSGPCRIQVVRKVHSGGL